jgi:Flp pilus assembly protein TadD
MIRAIVLYRQGLIRSLLLLSCSLIIRPALSQGTLPGLNHDPAIIISSALAPIPLDGQAWRNTEQAFNSYKKNNFAQAVEQVSLALLLRPDVTRLWLLKIYALQNQGLVQEALEVTEQAYQQGIRSSEIKHAQAILSQALLDNRKPLFTGDVGSADSISHVTVLTPLFLAKQARAQADPNWELVDAAYSSFKYGRYADTEQMANLAITKQPNDLNTIMLLVYALQKQGKIKQAQAAIQDALNHGLDSPELRLAQRSLAPQPVARTPSGSPVTPAYIKGFALAGQAFTDFKNRDFARAASGAQQAFELDPTQLDWAMLWMDALQAEGQYDQALAAIEGVMALSPNGRTALAKRKMELVRRQADQFAQAGYDAIHAKQPSQAATLARKAIALLPHNTNYWLLLIEALKLEHLPQEALIATNEAIQNNPEDAAVFLMQRGYLHQSLGDKALALEDFKTARATGHAPPSAILDLAYAQASNGDKRAAVESFKQAVDQADNHTLELSPEQLFNTRSSIANLSREWGAYLSASYRGARPASTAIGGAAITVPGDSTFSTAELFWRPASFLNSSTQTFEVYGRMSNTIYDGGSKTSTQSGVDSCGTGVLSVGDETMNKGVSGLPTSLGALGIRFTPSTDIGVTFGVERQFMLGTATRTGTVVPESNAARCALNRSNQNAQYQTGAGNGGWMTYVTYGVYDGSELRMGKPDWFTLEAYAQTGYSWQDMPTQVTLNDNSTGQVVQSDSGRLKRNQAFAAGEFRLGRSFRMDQISDHLVLFPYLVIGGDWLSTNNQITGLDIVGNDSIAMQGNGSSWSTGIGPGFNIRYWFREDHYNAPQSYLNTTIQYRFNVGGGEAARAKGLFINMTLSY